MATRWSTNTRLLTSALAAILLLIGSPGRAQQPMPAPAPAADPAPEPSQQASRSAAQPGALIELPPTPMLDAEGKQRLDPDGKPMWNPPVRQMRDKHGKPVFDEAGKPVFQTANDLGYDENGKKIHEKKEKAPKTTSLTVTGGTLTVDGMIGKAALNYDIADLHYIYLYAPWIGTVVVSNGMFPGAKEQPGAFNGNTLTVTVEDHQFQLSSDKPLLGKKPLPAYVLVDRDFHLPTRAPVVGYGNTLKAPYQWPGSKTPAKVAANAPPLPAELKPALQLAPCPTGQMRQASAATLAGTTPPCVPIAQARSAPVSAPAPAAPALEARPAAQPPAASATPPTPPNF